MASQDGTMPLQVAPTFGGGAAVRMRGMMITRAQLAKFHCNAEMAFQRNLMQHLRSFCPDVIQDIGDDDLARFVAAGMRIARAMDFTWQSSIASFVTLMAVIGPRFYDSPQVAAGLREVRSAADYRIGVLLRRLPPEAWDAATVADRPAAVRVFIAEEAA